MKKIRILIDTDIGTDIDDTWALAYAFSRECFEVVGVCVTGVLPRYRAAIVEKMLSRLGKNVPVFAGVCTHGEYITPQQRWIGRGEDFPLRCDYRAAFEEIFRRNPDIAIAALAPGSTLAAIEDLLVGYHIPVAAMAGSVNIGYFGAPSPCPECNIATDVAASRALYGSDVDVCMLPLDVCGTLRLCGEEYMRVKTSTSPAARAVMENYEIWHSDYEGSAKKFNIQSSSTILYDLAPLWYLEYPNRFSVTCLPLRITNTGMTVADGEGKEKKAALGLRGIEELLSLTAQTIAEGRRDI